MRNATFATTCRCFLSALLLSSLAGGEVSAQNIRSNDLMAHCSFSSGPDDYCWGFLNGYADAAQLYQLTAMLQTPRPTPPGNVPPFCLLSSDTDEVLAQPSRRSCTPTRIELTSSPVLRF